MARRSPSTQSPLFTVNWEAEPPPAQAPPPGQPLDEAAPGTAPAGEATQGAPGGNSAAEATPVEETAQSAAAARPAAEATPLGASLQGGPPAPWPAAHLPRSAAPPVAATPCSVSTLVRRLKGLVEEGLPPLDVLGELADVKQAASGIWFFSLRDAEASLRCVMFRGATLGLAFMPQNGMRVQARGRVSIYAPRGDVQLQVLLLQPQGEGARQALGASGRLAAEGLFAAARKRPLPFLPRAAGVVTSPHGAAIYDLLSVLQGRFPGLEVVLYPALVQGEGAAAEIAAGLQVLNRHAAEWQLDVLIICRGGGAREDLEAFDSEEVVRAVAGSALPVVSAVGHEVDVTLADLAADLRAPTPSAAAEQIVPPRTALLAQAARLRASLELRMQQLLRLAAGSWRGLHPRLLQTRSLLSLPVQRARLLREQQALAQAMRVTLREAQARVSAAQHALSEVSPLSVLARGYAAPHTPQGVRITSVGQVAPGQALNLLMHDGSLEVQVQRITSLRPEDLRKL